MKILFLMQLPPPVHGVTACNQLVRHLTETTMQFESRILALNYNKNIKELHNNQFRKLLIFIGYFFKLCYFLASFRPDKVYFVLSPHGVAFFRDLVFIALIRLCRIHLVYHLHGKGIADKKNWLLRLFRFAFQGADIICLSSSLASDVQQVATPKQIHIVHNGVDAMLPDEALLKSAKVALANGERPLRVAMLSNLQLSKGVDCYLELFAELAGEREDIEWHLAGPFTSDFTAEDLARFQQEIGSLVGRFVYHGALYGQDKYQFLADMDVLVHPSRNDAMPLVIIEALACGLCVVSTAQGGIADLLQGLPGATLTLPEQLREPLLALVGQKGRFSEFAAAARERYLQRHTQSIFLTTLEQVLLR